VLLTKLAGLSEGFHNLCLSLPGVTQSTADPIVLNMEISSARVGLFSIGATFLAMILGSLLVPDRDKDSNSDLK
jgi:hypothetical protein